MLHALAPALLSLPIGPSPAPDDLLLDLLPGDATVAIRIGDLASHVERPAGERGAWEAFMADERFVTLLELGLADAEFADAEGIDALGILLEVARFVEGGAIGMPSMDPDAITGVLRLREGHIEAWSGVLAHLGDSFEETEVAGLRGHVIGAGTGGVLALVDVGGLTVVGAGDEGAAMAGVRAQLAAMEDGPASRGWWSTVPERADGALVEAFIGYGALATMSAELALMDSLVQGLYVGAGIGEGSTGDLVLGAALHENEVAQAFADAMRPADLGLARRVPIDADVVSIANLDGMGLVEAFAALVDSLEPDAGAGDMVRQGLDAGSEIIGIDIEDDLLGNLTGHMLYAQWIDSLDALEADDMAALLDAAPVFAFGIDDPEPFLELLDISVGFLGDADPEVVESDLGAELVLRAPDVDDAELRVLVSDDWLVFGADPERVRALATGDAGEGWLSEADTRALEASDVATPGYSFARMPWLAEAMLDALALQGELSGVPPEAYDAAEALGEHVPGTMSYSMSVTARWVSMRFQTL